MANPDKPRNLPFAAQPTRNPVATATDAAAHVTADLRGAGRLVIDAVTGVTDIVEGMHRNIARVSPIIGNVPAGRTRGITGLVYRSVRGVTRAVGTGLDAVLSRFPAASSPRRSSPRREAILAALNGVLGDHLAATASPLAIPMQFRSQGQAFPLHDAAAFRAALGEAGGRVLVLVHGLCMNDLQWQRAGHDHGAALAADLGYTSIYLHYNTGRAIADNGREFSVLLERALALWPVDVEEITIIGHSMGGLVTRSACLQAQQSSARWLARLRRVVFLGTPHHGAPLERAGSWLDRLIGASPYTAPLVRLGATRSAGIKDLRHGRFASGEGIGARRAASVAQLPAGVRGHVVAATRAAATSEARRLPGDGLVPVPSALGKHRDPKRRLAVAAEHQAICHGLNHFDLLGRRAVYDHLLRWLR
jgi:pimeloyl-ACP methyl ester carboxylesterase